MVAAHHARTNDADAQAGLDWRRSFGTHMLEPRFNPIPGATPSTSPHLWRMPRHKPGHDLIQKVTRSPGLSGRVRPYPGPDHVIRCCWLRPLIVVFNPDDIVFPEIAAGL